MNASASHAFTSHTASASKDSELTASIVICSRKRPNLLRECLESVSRLHPAANEIIVVDNTEGDKATELIAEQFKARYIVEPEPGLSRARNSGLIASTSEIVAYLDDDARPQKDWLGFILQPFSEPAVASVTGDTFPAGYDDSAPSHGPVRTLCNKDPKWFEIATFGGLGYGTNMAIRKAACSGWKGFDVRLGRGAPLWLAEESHAFASLLDLGYCAVHVPAAIVIHPMKPQDLELEASSRVAYWLLLFWEFPGHRLDLVRFLLNRLRRKRLSWPRDPQGPGEIIKSGWHIYLKAALAGTLLYLRNRKAADRNKA